MTNILSDLRRLTEAVHAAGADIAPTYREYVQLAFAIATDCGEAGRSDFLMLCSLSAKYDVHAANKLFSNALKTNNNIRFLCHHIGNLTFSLISPVRSYDCFYHFSSISAHIFCA